MTSDGGTARRWLSQANSHLPQRRKDSKRPTIMSVEAQNRPGPSGVPARILVAGSDLLADALASALETYGFATMNILAGKPQIEEGIEWRPDLVLIDARSLDVTAGSALIREFYRVGLQVCVIDAADNGDRSNCLGERRNVRTHRQEPAF